MIYLLDTTGCYLYFPFLRHNGEIKKDMGKTSDIALLPVIG